MQLPTGNQLTCFGFGQAIMLLNVITGILTTYLSRENVSLPTLQSTALYIALALVYLPIKFFFLKSDKKTGVPIWFYMILGVVDVEGNYFAVKAFNYTSYFTAGLLLNLTVPFATLLCYVFLKTRYQWQHYVGAVVAICGSIVIFATDYDSSVASGVSNELRGDLYCVIAAMFYATSNVMVQSVVKTRDMRANVELLAFMGLFASIVSIVQVCALELKPIKDASFNWRVYSYMSGYVVDLFVFYSIVPVFLRWAESLFFNINLLTGPVFTVIASYAFFDQAIKPWYWAALVLFYIGLTMYATTPAPEETLKKADPLEEYHELETPKLTEPVAGDRV